MSNAHPTILLVTMLSVRNKSISYLQNTYWKIHIGKYILENTYWNQRSWTWIKLTSCGLPFKFFSYKWKYQSLAIDIDELVTWSVHKLIGWL